MPSFRCIFVMALRYSTHIRGILMSKIIVGFLLLFFPFAMPSASSAATEADQVVTSFHSALLQILNEQAGQTDQARYDALQPTMDNAFNFDVMIKTISGRHWRKANEAERAALRQAFRDLSIATYADQYAGLTDGSFQTITSRDGPRGLKLVDTELKTSSKMIGFTYVLREKAGNWQIIDVLLDGGKISELARKASEYSKTLKDGGANALISVLADQKESLLQN
jgi:phospholipid transport system substrate-binding protein